MDPKFNQIFTIEIPPEERIADEWVLRVLVVGENELPYSRPFEARFDTHRVEGLALDIHGTGFTGYLATIPPDGTALTVEIEGLDPIDTGLTFPSGGNV